MNIEKLIEQLQQYKAEGVRTVQISDAYFGYDFNIRTLCVPNFDRPTELIFRPINRLPDHDGITRETGVMFQEQMRAPVPLLDVDETGHQTP